MGNICWSRDKQECPKDLDINLAYENTVEHMKEKYTVLDGGLQSHSNVQTVKLENKETKEIFFCKSIELSLKDSSF